MQVKVRLFATFRAGRFTEEQRTYPAGTSVADVMRELEIAEDQVGMLMFNNRHVTADQVLEDGSSLGIFPYVGGG